MHLESLSLAVGWVSQCQLAEGLTQTPSLMELELITCCPDDCLNEDLVKRLMLRSRARLERDDGRVGGLSLFDLLELWYSLVLVDYKPPASLEVRGSRRGEGVGVF